MDRLSGSRYVAFNLLFSRKGKPTNTRLLTLFVIGSALCANAFSILLYSNLHDDQYHLAENALRYLYATSAISVLGGIGAWAVSCSTVVETVAFHPSSTVKAEVG